MDGIMTEGGDRFRAMEWNGRRVLLSIQEVLSIGEGTDIPGDETQMWYIYGEHVVLSGRFKTAGGVIAAKQLSCVPAGEARSAFLDAGGADGESAEGVQMPGGGLVPARSGGDGKPGGALDIYAESVSPASLLCASVRGGDGGAGQQGTHGAGGTGGKGGDGGSLRLLYGHSNGSIQVRLKEIYEIAEETKQKEEFQAFCEGLQSSSAGGAWLERVAKEWTGKTAQEAIFALSGALSAEAADWRRFFRTDAAGGEGGLQGAGQPQGAHGQKGNRGRLEVVALHPVDRSEQLKRSAMLFAHPAQCDMLLEKAKNLYFALDPASGGGAALLALLDRVVARTRIFMDMEEEAPLAQYYRAQEASIGAYDSVGQLARICREAGALRENLLHGLDYLGHPPAYVPLASFSFYQERFEKMKPEHARLEELYLAYHARQKEAEFAKSKSALLLSQSQKDEAAAERDIDLLRARLRETAQAILAAEEQLAPLKEQFLSRTEAYWRELQQAVSLPVKEILGSLSMIAFAPTSKLMWLTQGAGVLFQTRSELTDDRGDGVNREFVLHAVKEVEATFAALEKSAAQEADGALRLSDPGGEKLLAAEEQLRQLVERFYSKLNEQSEALLAQVKAYVEQVMARNGLVLQYNAVLSLLGQKHQMKAQETQRQAMLKQQAFQALCLRLPADEGLLCATVHRSRAMLMECLQMTARAYEFWALKGSHGLLAQALGGKDMPQLTAEGVSGAYETIQFHYAKAVEGMGSGALRFPAKEGQRGIRLPLGENHLASLRRRGAALVTLDPAYPWTTKGENPFAGFYDVRIRTVRVWLEGAKVAGADGVLQVNIVHTGDDAIVDGQGNKFAFTHEPRSTAFQFDTVSMKPVLGGQFGWQDKNTEKLYALAGPFTAWMLRVSKEWNEAYDLKGVTKGWMEFEGTFRPYSC